MLKRTVSTFAVALAEYVELVGVDKCHERKFNKVRDLTKQTRRAYTNLLVEQDDYTEEQIEELRRFCLRWEPAIQPSIFREDCLTDFAGSMHKVHNGTITHVKITEPRANLGSCRFELGLAYSYADIFPDMQGEDTLYTAVARLEFAAGVTVTLVPSHLFKQFEPSI